MRKAVERVLVYGVIAAALLFTFLYFIGYLIFT